MIEIFTSARTRILLELKNRPHTISEISKKTGYSKTTVSYHLEKLTEHGLVERNERGKWVYYKLTQRGLRKMRVEVTATLISLTAGVVSTASLIWIVVKPAFVLKQAKVAYEITPESLGGFDYTPVMLILVAVVSLSIFFYVRFFVGRLKLDELER